MKYQIGYRIKQLRENLGLNQTEFAEKIGVSNSRVSNWEKGINRPDVDFLSKICEVLQVSADDLLELNNSVSLNTKEQALINNYRNLTIAGQILVDNSVASILEYEKQHLPQSRSLLNTANNQPEDCIDNVIFIDTYTQSASAGTGQYLDDDSFQKLGYPANRVPANTDFAVPVAGDSMEPEYSDGDIVFVERSEDVAFGDIGLFVLNGEGFVKMCDPEGLVSLNPSYPLIKINDDCVFKTIGKILGKL